MKIRGLLIAAIVLAALSGGVWWSNKKKTAEEAKPPADTALKIVNINQNDITKVEIHKKGAEPVVLEKSAQGQWRITAPKQYGADQDVVNSMVSSLGPLSADKLVEEKAPDLSKYGLSDPSLTVAIATKDGKTRTILAGDDVPTGGGTFAALQGDPRVFTINSKGTFDKTLNDLRDKRPLTFDSDKLTRVDLTTKGQTVEFGKNNQNEWQILQPRPLRADGLQVEELIRKLKEARMDVTAPADDAKKAIAAFGSGTLVGTAKVTDGSGAQTLEVKKDKSGDYYAKSSVVDGIFKVTSDLGTALDKSLVDFRNKKLFDFGFSEPGKVEIQDSGKTHEFHRAGESWLSAGKKMDNVGLQSLIDKLRELAATKFVDTGFGNPAIYITVVSNEGKRTEKVSIAESGDKFIAKRENETSLYELDPKAVKDIEQAAADVKPAPEKKK